MSRRANRRLPLSERYEAVYACVGIHPLDMAEADDGALREIEKLSEHKKVVAIGEIGLDYYYDTTPKDKQQRMFRSQIEIAIRRNLPIVVHTRDSMDDAVSTVEEMIQRNEYWRSQQATSNSRFLAPKGVFHCFSGDALTARRLFMLGFLVSYPGIVTFKNSPAVETLKTIGYDHIMLETDSPYLTPAPHRGKRNEPMYIPEIGKKIAESLQSNGQRRCPNDDVQCKTPFQYRLARRSCLYIFTGTFSIHQSYYSV
jgi:TatD DNase family protein